MKKFMLVGLLLGVQLHGAAALVDNFKHDSQAFCDVIRHNNNLDSSLDAQFVFDSAKLVAIIKDMVYSLDDIALVGKNNNEALGLEQHAAINKHIMSLTITRKAVMHLKNKYKLPSQLNNIFDFYRNHLDRHYYDLQQSYESYLLKQCNVSLKNSLYTSMYATGSLASMLVATNLICGPSSRKDFEMMMGISLIPLGAYLVYCAYNKINDLNYEYELLS